MILVFISYWNVNFSVLEYDLILNDEHTKLIKTQEDPSEAEYILSNVNQIL
jgi:hypothetical protein